MWVTPAYAQTSAAPAASAAFSTCCRSRSSFVIMYFLILRPQRQQTKRREEMLKAIRRGDTVVTNGGLVGKVTKVVDDNELELQIAEGVKVRAVRSLIAEVRTKAEPVAGNSPSGRRSRHTERQARCSISSAGRSRSSCSSRLAGIVANIPNFFSAETVASWPTWLPKRQIVLGLDLRGGAHLLARGGPRQPGQGSRQDAGRRRPADACATSISAIADSRRARPGGLLHAARFRRRGQGAGSAAAAGGAGHLGLFGQGTLQRGGARAATATASPPR